MEQVKHILPNWWLTRDLPWYNPLKQNTFNQIQEPQPGGSKTYVDEHHIFET